MSDSKEITFSNFFSMGGAFKVKLWSHAIFENDLNLNTSNEHDRYTVRERLINIK